MTNSSTDFSAASVIIDPTTEPGFFPKLGGTLFSATEPGYRTRMLFV